MAELAQIFNLPDLGEGLTEAEIVSWHVAVGDHVVADQPLVSVETDKAVVEVPSPRSGRIETLFCDVGDVVATGAPLVAFAGEAGADTGAVVGEIPKAAPERPPAEAARPAPAKAPSPAKGGAIKAAPAVRALARELGVDLAEVKPTGAGGGISREDVQKAAAQGGRAGAIPPGRGEAVTGLRRAMARNMARAHSLVVPATVTDLADIGDWAEDEDVMARLIGAVAAGSKAEPALNAWFDGDAMRRLVHEKVDLGIAVDTAEGLVVPVLRDAGKMAGPRLRKEVERLKSAAASRSLSPADLRGATISLSNFGTMAGRHAALVVMPPQVAILGAGKIGWEVAARGGKPVLRRMMPLSLTFDHRAVSGGEAAKFLAAVTADLERAESG